MSDFIDEVHGYLKHNEEEARTYLKHQIEGYWTNEHMIVQVNKAIRMFESKYPNCTALYLFDNAI